MNTFYEVEGRIFETFEQADEWKTKNQQLAKITDFTTEKDFNTFVDDYEEERYANHESIFDSIEMAR